MDFTGQSGPPVTLAGDLTGAAFPGVPEFLYHGSKAHHGYFDGDRFVTTEYGTFITTSSMINVPIDPPLFGFDGRFVVVSGEQVTSGFLMLHGTFNEGTAILTHTGILRHGSRSHINRTGLTAPTT